MSTQGCPWPCRPQQTLRRWAKPPRKAKRSPRVWRMVTKASMSPMPSLKPTRLGQRLGQHHQAGSAEAAGAPVVDDDADLHAPAYGLHMGHQAFLAGFGQIMGQQQDALRA